MMIFSHTWEKVLSGEKTQTRRLKKPGQKRSVYKVGQTYAVQPGRGKKAVARIRITDIWEEDVRRISEKDVLAEGFLERRDFLGVWCKMHDTKWADSYNTMDLDEFAKALLARPVDRYLAWVLEFQLVTNRGR